MKPGCHLTASDGALRSPCQGINAVARQSDRQPRAATEFGLGFFLVVVGNPNGALKGALQVLCSRRDEIRLRVSRSRGRAGVGKEDWLAIDLVLGDSFLTVS